MNAIEIRDLGKRYQLGERGSQFKRIGEVLRDRLSRSTAAEDGREFWALRHVDVSVAAGEVVGLIGANGAGKSTLLKILSRIVVPTEGEASLQGRVGSLLEVGTGFHPELTGRENALLNGAILGMSRRDVMGRLDDIIDFSETGRFLNTPVKRYSSGMYMRLAFAVAAFLETEILLVDEVLAVGDVAFQRRCLGKMHEVSQDGRTVIFVSHSLGSITQLCERAVWLDQGTVRSVGGARSVVDEYLAASTDLKSGGAVWDRTSIDAAQIASIVRAAVGVVTRGETSKVDCADEIFVEIRVDVHQYEPGLSVAFYLTNARGVIVVSSDIIHADPEASERLRPGLHNLRVTLPSRLLAPDTYTLSVMLRSPYEGDIDEAAAVCRLDVVDTSGSSGARRAGVVGYNFIWRHDTIGPAGAP